MPPLLALPSARGHELKRKDYFIFIIGVCCPPREGTN